VTTLSVIGFIVGACITGAVIIGAVVILKIKAHLYDEHDKTTEVQTNERPNDT
jgi:hypothetical protein